MAIFENSDTLSPNSEFFYLSSNHDVLYSHSDTTNTFCLDVPSYFISSRYGKLAFHIYRNLLCSNCIARLSSKHIRVNFIKLFVNSYLKLKMNKTPNEPSEKLNKFILALPSVEQLKKYICKIELFVLLHRIRRRMCKLYCPRRCIDFADSCKQVRPIKS